MSAFKGLGDDQLFSLDDDPPAASTGTSDAPPPAMPPDDDPPAPPHLTDDYFRSDDQSPTGPPTDGGLDRGEPLGRPVFPLPKSPSRATRLRSWKRTSCCLQHRKIWNSSDKYC